MALLGVTPLAADGLMQKMPRAGLVTAAMPLLRRITPSLRIKPARRTPGASAGIRGVAARAAGELMLRDSLCCSFDCANAADATSVATRVPQTNVCQTRFIFVSSGLVDRAN